MNTPDAGVSCRNVRKEFGRGEARVEALRGVDFDAPLGGLSFLVGPSGCGKTTLISIVAGLMERTSGTMSVLGQRLDDLSASERVGFRRRHLGFVFQQYNLLPALTAAENVAVPLIASGMARRPATDRARALLSALGLEAKVNTLPRTLSGGQQQRVAIARALIHEPRLVVCDEPTAALDHARGDQVMKLLASTAVHADRVVIVVTHDSRVFGYADTISHMDDGRVVSVTRGTPQPSPLNQMHEPQETVA